ncbi:unnamed protein product, partial [Mesorhabditis spiculigera]
MLRSLIIRNEADPRDVLVIDCGCFVARASELLDHLRFVPVDNPPPRNRLKLWRVRVESPYFLIRLALALGYQYFFSKTDEHSCARYFFREAGHFPRPRSADEQYNCPPAVLLHDYELEKASLPRSTGLSFLRRQVRIESLKEQLDAYDTLELSMLFLIKDTLISEELLYVTRLRIQNRRNRNVK